MKASWLLFVVTPFISILCFQNCSRMDARKGHVADLSSVGLNLRGGLNTATATGKTTRLPYKTYYSPRRINSEVYRSEGYNHAAAVAVFKQQIYVAWNGNRYTPNEGYAGQVIMLSTSGDGGVHWTPPQIPFVKEYRAYSYVLGKGVDAAYGNADDNHKIKQKNQVEWQPSLVVFKGKLLMFWGINRNSETGGLMMSQLEENTRQWRSYELHFKRGTGKPYMYKVENVDSAQYGSPDPSSLTIRSDMKPAYPDVDGAGLIPNHINIPDLPIEIMDQESLTGRPVSMPASLVNQSLVPFPGKATVIQGGGKEVLAVPAILQQSLVDWQNLAVKIPAILTTTDLVNWKINIVPLKYSNGIDFLRSSRGDIGLLASWEPSLSQNENGAVELALRIVNPPLSSKTDSVSGRGRRIAFSYGRYSDANGLRMSVPLPADYDVVSSREALGRIPGSKRWVMVTNNSEQGLTYSRSGIPQFLNETRYQPWARNNMTVFFSTRGLGDYVAGLNVSSTVEKTNLELVHYPDVWTQKNSATGKDELYIVYSTHRRSGESCVFDGDMSDCSDSIQFVRLEELPDANAAAIYPNHFAAHFSYGKAVPRPNVYSVDKDGILHLHDRASAGIDTMGDSGCMNLTFQLGGSLAEGASRPVISFGRSSSLTSYGGLRIGRHNNVYSLIMGNSIIQSSVKIGAWNKVRVCYDYVNHKISVGSIKYAVPSMTRRAYLGDSTLAQYSGIMPDLSFSVSEMSLEYSNPAGSSAVSF